MPLTISLIPYASPAYHAALTLREAVLRAPLGLSLIAEELAADAGYLHLGAFEGAALVGCLLAVRLEGNAWKLRQVAVVAAHQGKGIGRAMTEFIERELRTRGAETLTLNARETAAPFYEKLGYRAVGEIFTEHTIPHVQMEKTL